jgi:7-cyano-7-deazaguanine synthase in queuosine biosynthesis
VELQAAQRIAKSLGAVDHKVVRIALDEFGGSALTDAAIAVPEQPGAGIPVTYVPARNGLPVPGAGVGGSAGCDACSSGQRGGLFRLS